MLRAVVAMSRRADVLAAGFGMPAWALWVGDGAMWTGGEMLARVADAWADDETRRALATVGSLLVVDVAPDGSPVVCLGGRRRSPAWWDAWRRATWGSPAAWRLLPDVFDGCGGGAAGCSCWGGVGDDEA